MWGSPWVSTAVQPTGEGLGAWLGMGGHPGVPGCPSSEQPSPLLLGTGPQTKALSGGDSGKGGGRSTGRGRHLALSHAVQGSQAQRGDPARATGQRGAGRGWGAPSWGRGALGASVITGPSPCRRGGCPRWSPGALRPQHPRGLRALFRVGIHPLQLEEGRGVFRSVRWTWVAGDAELRLTAAPGPGVREGPWARWRRKWWGGEGGEGGQGGEGEGCRGPGGGRPNPPPRPPGGLSDPVGLECRPVWTELRWLPDPAWCCPHSASLRLSVWPEGLGGQVRGRSSRLPPA